MAQHPVQVIAVAGGKGGVGKSNVTVNLACSLSELGRKVVVLDADLGLANIDVLLGISANKTIENVLRGECTLRDVMVNGPGNVKIVPATSGAQHLSMLTTQEHAGLIQAFSDIGDELDILLIDTAATLESALDNMNLPVYKSAVWDLLEISEGFVQLSDESSGEYVPQMLNLQAVNGISFTKGCYLGQETVARMQYLGKNKKALFSLSTSLKQPLQNDDVIEKQLGENWRKAGDVISFYQSHNNNVLIQAVLAKDTDESTPLRIQGMPNCNLSVNQLPYSLTEA